jgi:O-antigen/teichoic acid export membrane protein
MSLKKYYLKHQKFTKTLSIDVVTKGLGFLFIPVFLKFMTKEEFGLYSYLVFAILNISYLLRGGLDSSLTKLYFDYTGRDKGRVVFTISMAIIILYCLFLVVCLLTSIDDWLFFKITSGKVKYDGFFFPVVAYILLYNLTAILNNYYIATNNVFLFQKWNLVKVVAQNIVAFVLIKIAVTSNSASVRLLAEAVAGLIFLLPLYIHFTRGLIYSFDLKIFKRALAIGVPTLGGILIGIIYTFSDKFYLQKYSGIEALAVYNLGMVLVTPIGLIFGSFHLLWLSEFFQENDLKLSFKKTKKVYLRFLLVYLVLFVVLFFGVWLILKLNIISHAYYNVLFVLPLIYIYRVLENLCHLFDNFYIKIEKTIFTLFLTVIIGTVTLFLFLKLIPVYGMFGCAFVLVGMELIRTFLMVTYIRYRIFNPPL